MKVTIYSREKIENIITDGNFPQNTAVISFCDPELKHTDSDYTYVDYSTVCKYVYYCEIDDLENIGSSYYSTSSQDKVSSYSKEIAEINMLASGGWKCVKCERVNPSYNTGSCVCGNSKMENEKIKTAEIRKDNSTSELQNIQKLKSYKELLDIGAISQEEFDVKKKELL